MPESAVDPRLLLGGQPRSELRTHSTLGLKVIKKRNEIRIPLLLLLLFLIALKPRVERYKSL